MGMIERSPGGGVGGGSMSSSEAARPRFVFSDGRDVEVAAARLSRLVEANVCGFGLGREGVLVEGNDALLAVIGAQSVNLEIGIPLHVLFGVDGAAVEALLNGRVCEYDITRMDGVQAHVLACGVRVDPPNWMILVIDLSERKAAERAIRHLALHDPTTGVPNRRLLMDRLEHALARARRERSVVGVLFCDIDRFKDVNDHYGHRAGDAVLQTTARRLGSVLRQHDTVARVGGDEFVVLLERLADVSAATRLAERVRVAIKQPIDLDDHHVVVTASVGVAATNETTSDADTLLRCADDVMYVAKRRGRDQVAVHPDAIAAHDAQT